MGDVHDMRLVGGQLALDFVNTFGGRKEAPDDEYLLAYAHLLAWSERTGSIDPPAAAALARSARRSAQSAQAALDAALALRAHLDAILRATLARRAPRAADLEALRRAEVDALAHATLRPDFAWT